MIPSEPFLGALTAVQHIAKQCKELLQGGKVCRRPEEHAGNPYRLELLRRIHLRVPVQDEVDIRLGQGLDIEGKIVVDHRGIDVLEFRCEKPKHADLPPNIGSLDRKSVV